MSLSDPRIRVFIPTVICTGRWVSVSGLPYVGCVGGSRTWVAVRGSKRPAKVRFHPTHQIQKKYRDKNYEVEEVERSCRVASQTRPLLPSKTSTRRDERKPHGNRRSQRRPCVSRSTGRRRPLAPVRGHSAPRRPARATIADREAHALEAFATNRSRGAGQDQTPPDRRTVTP